LNLIPKRRFNGTPVEQNSTVKEAVSQSPSYRIFWLASEPVIVSVVAADASIAWTAVDISAYVSNKARVAYLRSRLGASTLNANAYVYADFRENGVAHTYYPEVSLQQKTGMTTGAWTDQMFFCGLSPVRVLQYQTVVSGTIVYDMSVILLGYGE
jgi:hypothetical protein